MIELTQQETERYTNGVHMYDIVNEVVRRVAPHHIVYGLRNERIIQKDGKYYADWDIYGSCG